MVVTPDNSTLIVAESYAPRLTSFGIAADSSLQVRMGVRPRGVLGTWEQVRDGLGIPPVPLPGLVVGDQEDLLTGRQSAIGRGRGI